ncbi:hypothetical protein BH10PSE19_BH10PSE19_12280 [soil metagenome]
MSTNENIEFADFQEITLCIGTVINAKVTPKQISLPMC